MLRPREASRGLHLSGFAGALVNLVTYDASCDVVEVVAESFVEFLEFRPKNLVDEWGRCPEHHRRMSLTGEAIGLEPISPAQGDEQHPAPLIPQRELRLDRRVAS